jgi:hypothetical protein
VHTSCLFVAEFGETRKEGQKNRKSLPFHYFVCIFHVLPKLQTAILHNCVLLLHL